MAKRQPVTTILQAEYSVLIKQCADLDIALIGGDVDRIKYTAQALVNTISGIYDRKATAEVRRMEWADKRTPKKTKF